MPTSPFLQCFTRQSKFTYGLVLEEVTTRDETSAICDHGARTLPSGALTSDGPPTTHSDTGIDRVAFVQANLTHDNTQFVNGTPIGDRHIFQVRLPFSQASSLMLLRLDLM